MNVLDIIRETSARETTRFSFELLPPLKGDGTRSVFTTIEALREFDPAFINVTFHRESIKETLTPDGHIEWHRMRRRPGTVGISAAIRDRFGIEVVPHLICGGLSRYDIEDALIDMDFLGLHNVLALRGDCGPNERHFMPHPQPPSTFLPFSISHSKFSIGVAGYPEKHVDALDAESDLRHLKAKVDAGADYVMTQICYDADRILAFIGRCREAGIDVPVIPGVKPLSTLRQLTLLPETFAIELPEALRSEVRAHADRPEVIRRIGVEWAVDQCRRLKAAGVPMIHFYTMGRAENVRQIIKEVF